MSPAAIAARRAEQEDRLKRVSSYLEERTGWPASTFLTGLTGRVPRESKRKFEPPFFVIYKGGAPVLGTLLRRNKSLETQKLEEARSVVIMDGSLSKVGDYVSGPFEINTGGAYEHQQSATIIDLENPLRARSLSYHSLPPEKIGYGTADETSGKTTTRGFTIDDQNLGTLLDDMLSSVVGKRDDPDFDPPDEPDLRLWTVHPSRVPKPRVVFSLEVLDGGAVLMAQHVEREPPESGHVTFWNIPLRKRLPSRTLPATTNEKLNAASQKTIAKKNPVEYDFSTGSVAWCGPVLSPDGQFLVAGDAGIHVWNLSMEELREGVFMMPELKLTPEAPIAPKVFTQLVKILRFSPDGRFLLAVASPGGPESWIEAPLPHSLVVVQLTGKPSLKILPAHSQAVEHLLVAADGEMAVTAAGETLRFWSPPEGTLLREVKPGSHVAALVMTDQGEVAAGLEDGSIQLLNVDDSKSRAPLRALSKVTALCVSPDGVRLYSGHANGDIYEWDLATGHRID